MGEDHHPGVVENGVALHLPRGAEGSPVLLHDGFRVVVHPDRPLLHALGHLQPDAEVYGGVLVEGPLYGDLLEAGKEGGVEAYGRLEPELRGHLPREHVYLPLVHPGGSHVKSHLEYVACLHRRVEGPRRLNVALVRAPPHYGHRPQDSAHRRRLHHLYHLLPVVLALD